MKNPITTPISELSTDDITRVYSGKAGKCCCGCAGKYSDTDRAKNRVLRILREHPILVERGDNHIAVALGSRLHIAYFD